MTAWRSLQSTDTGHVFASTLGASNWWEWIESAVAHEFECDVDDVDLFEDDDMNEFVTVHGEIVAQIHHAYVRNPSQIVAAKEAA